MSLFWNKWNTQHIAKHGIHPREAEEGVGSARPPFPQTIRDGRQPVLGRTAQGRYPQVIFVTKETESIDPRLLAYDQLLELADSDEPFANIIHAREMTPAEKHRFRRRFKLVD